MITKTKKVITKDVQSENVVTQDTSIWQNALRLFYLLCLTMAVGYIGSTFTSPEALKWYDTLILSDLTPPNNWFGPVWSVLYFLMAISAFLVWGKASPRPFVMQLAFNLIWPFAFFYLKNPVLAFVILIAMVVFIVKTICSFGRVSLLSGWLMVPVLLWSLFAGYLNVIVIVYNTKIGSLLGII